MSAEEYLAKRQAQFNQGDFIGCLAELDQLFRDPQITPEQVRPIWNEFMLGPKQLLLRATRQASKSGDRTTIDSTRKTIERLFGSFDLTKPPQTVEQLLKPHDKLSFHALFEAQLHLVDVFLSEFDQSEIKARLGYAIDKLTEAWGLIDYDAQKPFGLPYADAESTGQLSRASADHDYPPAFWNQLRPKWQTILSKFGLPHSVGWSHPAFLAVAQWIAWLLSDEDEIVPQCEHSATTQIAMMSEGEDGLLLGVLGRLTVERIPGGRRFVYPDPLRSGGFLCDTIFAESIHRAVQVALGKELAVAQCDFRWSLVIEDSLNHPIYTSLTGRSGDVAIAAALRAAARDETLDGHVVVTAQFADTSSVNPPLKPVQGIVAKLLGLRETLHGAAVAKHVDELIVSRKQPEVTDPATRASLGADVQAGRIHLTPADDFNAAYEQLALFPRLTAHVKAALHARSGELLGKLCNPYLRNPLAVIEREPSADPERRDIVVNERLLTDEEVEYLEHGDFSAFNNRIYLEADSGFGKSTFLLHLEHTLSRPDSGPLLPLRYGAGPKAWDERNQQPIFLPALSTLELAGDLRALLHGPLLTATLLSLLPLNTPETTKHNWIDWCQRRNLFVFLFDALDQTTLELANLGTHLDSLPDCPAILSGRPRSQQTQHAMFATIAWQPVILQGLQLEQVQEYLGDERVEQHHDWFYDWNKPDHLWRPILEVPAVLRMVRELPVEALATLKNREHVYAKTVEQLLQHGRETLRWTNAPGDQKRRNFARVIQTIAWHTWFPEGSSSPPVFTGELTGDAYDAALAEAKIDHEYLRQVNFVTERSWLRGIDEYGVLWRHRSFCEYFAALYFLQLDRDARERILQQHWWQSDLDWLFRFALCAAERLQSHDLLAELAQDLMRFGRTMFVWNTIKHDGIELPQQWDDLCRWLVHRDCDSWDAWEAGKLRPTVDADVQKVLADVMAPEYRDSRFLYPAWELLSESSLSEADTIRAKFLKEFANLAAQEQQRERDEPGFDRQRSPVLQLIPEEELSRLDELDHAACRQLVSERRNWRSCPPDPQRDSHRYIRGADRGSDPNAEPDEGPPRSIELTPFVIQSGLVTNAQYELFDRSHARFRDRYSCTDTQPVHEVSWYMATMFTIWLTGTSAALSRVYRLPTEAEWEYACRAGTVTPYSVGDGHSLTQNEANFLGCFEKTLPMGMYLANGWGICDMHGNLWEWCWDTYDDRFYSRSNWCNPVNSQEGNRRVNRGGSWNDYSVGCRSANRNRRAPNNRNGDLGFRLVRGLRPRLDL